MLRGFFAWLFALVIASCGARSSLQVPPPLESPQTASSAFCERAEYRVGRERLSIYLVLDRSGSMKEDQKWTAATAAIGTFVNDPATAGLSMGLGFFPKNGLCNQADYELPDVPIGKLPDIGKAITGALAKTKPEGETPTRLALRAAIAYAGVVMTADPSSEVVVAVLTDGAPNQCGSTDDALAQTAAAGLQGNPPVRTFVIGLETGYLESLSVIAKAGGTGAPVLIGKDGAAQSVIDALRELRETVEGCHLAIPAAPPPAQPRASDVSVVVASASGERTLVRVANKNACIPSAFTVDDPPTRATLCPSTCEGLRGDASARVKLTLGCGGGSKPIGSSECSSVVTFSCYTSCQAKEGVAPICESGIWVCPPGTKPFSNCEECDPVPHGCCHPDANLTLAQAPCIDGEWVCPAGTIAFGKTGCKAPAQCASLLPCPAGSYCKVADLTCGEENRYGSCQAAPAGCGKAEEVAACGCNGVAYPSACAARAAGVDLSIAKECAGAPNKLRCGPLYCEGNTHACTKTIRVSGSTEYACVPIPAGCAMCNSSKSCKLCGCGPECGPDCKFCGESCTNTSLGEEITCAKP
jgi:hypothetical protein